MFKLSDYFHIYREEAGAEDKSGSGGQTFTMEQVKQMIADEVAGLKANNDKLLQKRKRLSAWLKKLRHSSYWQARKRRVSPVSLRHSRKPFAVSMPRSLRRKIKSLQHAMSESYPVRRKRL